MPRKERLVDTIVEHIDEMWSVNIYDVKDTFSYRRHRTKPANRMLVVRDAHGRERRVLVTAVEVE